MVTKSNLLNNIRGYTPAEIAEAINLGVVTFYELRTETRGAFTPLMQKRVKHLLTGSPQTGPTFTNPSQPKPLEPLAIDEIPPLNLEPEVTIAMPEPLPEPPKEKPQQLKRHKRKPAVGHSQKQPVDSEQKGTGMFGSVFSFEGRIRRFEFAVSLFIYLIFLTFTVLLVIRTLTYRQMETYVIIITIFLIPLSWFMLAQATKRCHDIEKSGWNQLIPGYIFFLLFDSGTPSTNRYGYPPK